MKGKAYILKIALFATGLSGIVSEYILATLATYFLGDSVIQWTLIISLMLFFMGLGSRLTQYFSKNLFTVFVLIEFALSLIVSFSALLTYTLSGYSNYTGVLIYGLATITGALIGMELPLAVRLNERFEELRFNVSSILEKDYYGSLLGGVFFAFVGLPYLGLSHTPFVLGAINLGVAIALLNFFPTIPGKVRRRALNLGALALVAVIGLGVVNAKEIILYGEQKKYIDQVVYSEQSRYQKIVLTRWKDDHWLYLDGNLQFSSYDEPLYHEVLVHPPMQLHEKPTDVLILGGGDGCAARELLKYPNTPNITIVDLDPAITRLAREHEILRAINQDALHHDKVKVINRDALQFMEKVKQYYDLIIIDLPDPRNVELSRLYSYEFYRLCRRQLRPNGLLITQAGSPYFASRSFKCIRKTMKAAGFSVLPMHNQVITMGEWGWVLGAKAQVDPDQMIARLKRMDLEGVETQWLNREAVGLITSFGKDYFDEQRDSVRVNRIHHPVVHKYFLRGEWSVY